MYYFQRKKTIMIESKLINQVAFSVITQIELPFIKNQVQYKFHRKYGVFDTTADSREVDTIYITTII